MLPSQVSDYTDKVHLMTVLLNNPGNNHSEAGSAECYEIVIFGS